MKAILVCVWLSAASLAAQTPLTAPPARSPQTQEGNASIEGKVVDALTQEPVRKASIQLSGRIGLTAVTDASGQFAFRRLPAGQYFIQAQHEKYPGGGPSIDFSRQTSVSVAAAEQKSGIELKLMPGGSVSGHIVDEEGNPMPRCSVSPMRFEDSGTGSVQVVRRNPPASSDEKGEYRIDNVAAGKYYVLATCGQTLPLPHAFLRREEAQNAPALVYPPLFYPAAPAPSAAARVTVSAGGAVTGIDFRLVPSTGFTLRGHAHPVPSDRYLIVALQPTEGSAAQWNSFQNGIDSRTGDFRIPRVTRGSYELTVSGGGSDCSCYAKISVQVGDAAPGPIDVPISPSPRITGSVSVEGETKMPLDRLRVMLLPIANRYVGPPPQTSVESDGSFALSVVPGHWRLTVNGAPGYIKSVMLGDQEVSPGNLETSAAPAPLKITIGTKNAQVDGAVSDPPTVAGSLVVAIWPADESVPVRQSSGVDPQGHFSLQVPPGHYHICALPATHVGMMYNSRALRKGLEDRCPAVDAADGNRSTVTVPVLSADDLQHLQDTLDDAPPQ